MAAVGPKRRFVALQRYTSGVGGEADMALAANLSASS
jgi:hypothetical protein